MSLTQPFRAPKMSVSNEQVGCWKPFFYSLASQANRVSCATLFVHHSLSLVQIQGQQLKIMYSRILIDHLSLGGMAKNVKICLKISVLSHSGRLACWSRNSFKCQISWFEYHRFCWDLFWLFNIWTHVRYLVYTKLSV